MRDKLQRQIERLTHAHKRHSRWQRLVVVLACAVALYTLGVLMMPAVAMEGEPRCGQAEQPYPYRSLLYAGADLRAGGAYPYRRLLPGRRRIHGSPGVYR